MDSDYELVYIELSNLKIGILILPGLFHGPNPTTFIANCTTIGPATVLWEFEIYEADDAWPNSTAGPPLVFVAAGSQLFGSDAGKRNCGSFVVMVVATVPRAIKDQASWTGLEQ